MRKLISFIIITLLLCIFTTGAFASDTDINKKPEDCATTLVNNTDKTYIFWLSWIDHPFLHQTWGRPWHKIVAELDPGESFTAENRQAPGLYTVKYQEAFHYNTPMIAEDFIITAENKTIIITLIPDDNGEPIILIFKYD